MSGYVFSRSPENFHCQMITPKGCRVMDRLLALTRWYYN